MFPNFRSWFLQNQTTFQIMQGQFEPVNMSKNVKPNWVGHTALNRANEILQFLNQSADTVSFDIVLYDRDSVFSNAEEDYYLLESWAKPDEIYGNRPPVLTFWVGTGWEMMDCVIESLSPKFGRPTWFGNIRSVQASITLRKYTAFDLESKAAGETRYHRAAVRDYYEMLTQKEYGNPMLGDVIRKRHPTKPNVQTGDVIKLPSIEAIRKDKVETKSVALQTAYGKKQTPQRDLRREMFERRNRTYVSHVIIAD